MRTTVLYKSKYGASARYASMLAEALGTEAQELDRAGAAALLKEKNGIRTFRKDRDTAGSLAGGIGT